MTLTPTATQTLHFTNDCYLKGFCTKQAYLKAVASIYKEDTAKQVEFLLEQGFTHSGAIRNIYNLDKKEALCQ